MGGTSANPTSVEAVELYLGNIYDRILFAKIANS